MYCDRSVITIAASNKTATDSGRYLIAHHIIGLFCRVLIVARELPAFAEKKILGDQQTRRMSARLANTVQT